MNKKIDRFIEISECVDRLKVDKFLHEGRFNYQESVSKNLDNLMKYIKNDTK